MRSRVGLVIGQLLAVALAVPVAANTLDRFTFDDVLTEEYSCGVVVTTHVHGDGTAHLEADGAWLFTTIRIRYDGEAVEAATGETIALDARQVLKEMPGSAALMGQGTFIRVSSRGVVLGDVGRLVFHPSDGSTLAASAHVVPFDDPAATARVDAAVCSLFD